MAEQTLTIKLDVLDQASAKLRTFQNNLTSMKKDMSASVGGGGVPGVGGARGGAAGGIAGAIGGGAVGALAGLTIIGGAVVKILQKSYQLLAEASPYLKSIGDQFQTAFKIFLRPLGDSIAKALQPASEYAIEQSEAMAEFVESADEQFGVIGALIATWVTWNASQYMALADVLKGIGEFVWNTVSGLGQWIFDSIAGIISGGISSLSEFGGWLLDYILDALGPFGDDLRGIGEWVWGIFTGAFDALTGLGTWIWDGITGAIDDAWTFLSGLGTWIWDSIIGVFDTAWTFLTDLGTDIYNGIWNAISGIGTEAYKAFRNAIATMLNAISGIELPLIGKPFKGLFGEIPMLASGGIVTKPTLAMIGEAGPEAVVPLGRGGGMGEGASLNVYGNIYGVDDLERTFNDWYSKNQTGYSTYR